MNKITLLKIIGGMIISFIIAFFAIRTVFVSSSPKLRPYLGQYIISLVTQRSKSSVPKSVSSQALTQSLHSIPFNNNSPGIYTKRDTQTSYLLIKENEVPWENYSVNNNGKQVVVRIPKGEQLPQQNIISSITP